MSSRLRGRRCCTASTVMQARVPPCGWRLRMFWHGSASLTAAPTPWGTLSCPLPSCGPPRRLCLPMLLSGRFCALLPAPASGAWAWSGFCRCKTCSPCSRPQAVLPAHPHSKRLIVIIIWVKLSLAAMRLSVWIPFICDAHGQYPLISDSDCLASTSSTRSSPCSTVLTQQVGRTTDAQALHSSAEAFQAFALSVTHWCLSTKQALPFLPALHNSLQQASPHKPRVPPTILPTLQLPDGPIRLATDASRTSTEGVALLAWLGSKAGACARSLPESRGTLRALRWPPGDVRLQQQLALSFADSVLTGLMAVACPSSSQQAGGALGGAAGQKDAAAAGHAAPGIQFKIGAKQAGPKVGRPVSAQGLRHAQEVREEVSALRFGALLTILAHLACLSQVHMTRDLMLLVPVLARLHAMQAS